MRLSEDGCRELPHQMEANVGSILQQLDREVSASET